MRLPSRRPMRAYARLLSLLRGRDGQERRAIESDAQRLLRDARARGRGALAGTWLALGWDLVVSGGRDLGRAARSIVRAPGFVVTASLLLGLGVATTTTSFALVDAVLLTPLPYDEPERLVMVWESNPPQQRNAEGPSPGNLADWVENSDAFEALAGWWIARATLRGPDGSAPVTGAQVTRGFFDVFRRSPLLGRTFADHEYVGMPSVASGRTGGAEPIVVLSHRLWHTLGADPALVGQTVSIEGRHWRVLGVMPADFRAPDAETAFWTPWDVREAYRGPRFPDGPPRDFRFLRVAGRLKSGVSHEAAGAGLARLAARIAADHPRTNDGWTATLAPLHDDLVGTSRTGLLLVFGAVAALLLLVCANVATLAIARRTAQMRDAAIRLALGASRARLVRAHLAETVLCALVTATVALVVTAASLGTTVAFAPADIPRLHEVALNGRVVSFALAAALVVTVIGVFLPGLRGGDPAIGATLKDGTQGCGPRAGRVRRALVAAEIAVTVALLVGAGLLTRSYAGLQRVDPGFSLENVLVLRLAPDVTRYADAPARNDYYARVLGSIRALPGVASAGAVTALPMSTIGSDFYRPYWLEGPRPDGNAIPLANVRMATPGYFATLGLRLVSGREFSDRDGLDAPAVVIVNESLALRAWPGQDPVGRPMIVDLASPSPRRVVGVVADARYRGPRSEPAPELFVPHAQNPYLVMNVVVRTAIDADAVAHAARARALGVDPDQPVHSVTTMERLLEDTLQQDRFAMLFVGLFAVAGLVTAAAGVYALLTYSVAQRTREIAVRMAIGASAASVARSVVAESLALAAAGCAIGALGVAFLRRLVESMLFGIAPGDPLTLMATAAVLLAAVLAASWLPARRAARVNPVSVMRV